MGPQGLERDFISNGYDSIYEKGVVGGGVEYGVQCAILAEIISIWPELTPEKRETVLASIRSMLIENAK